MNKRILHIIFIALLSIIFSSMSISAEGGGDKKTSSIKGINGEPSYTRFNINRISTWFKNDGESDITIQGNSGLVYPKGSNKTAVFISGLMWGAKIDTVIHVGGSKYKQSTFPGRVINGVRVSPNDPDVRIFRVRRDYLDSYLSSEIDDGEGTIDQIRTQYAKDWNEWPAAQGAPYEDLDANGEYNPQIDIPGVPGADQTIWFVCNDFDTLKVKEMSGSIPLGIEEQATIWGYNSESPLGNMLFRKYILINKNLEQKPFTDMYVSMWSDADIGEAFNDQIGCDTTLNLGFIYNGNADDNIYEDTPPAVGIKLIQGPLVSGNLSDIAKFKGKYFAGLKNMEMTAFYSENDFQSNVTLDPDPSNYTYGTIGMYNYFQGKFRYGVPIINPITNKETKFMYSGDPISATGWLSYNNDQRMGVTSGPFNMAYGDTQEVVFAEILAGATEGIDRLQALALLKEYSVFAQNHYNNSFYNFLPPIPLSPKDNEIDVETDPILNWTVIEGAINYSLQIAADKEFKNILNR